MKNLNNIFLAKISLIMAIRMLGLFMILPVFTVLGKNYLYANELLIGVAIGVYGLTQGILQIPFGYLSDRFGRKKLMIIGLLLFAIGSFISAMSDNIYLVIFGRLLAGAGAIASVIMAFVGDIIPEEKRPKTFAILGVQIGIAFMIALIVGPFIALNYGLSGIFYSTGILAIIAIIITLSLPNSPTTSQYTLSTQEISSILTTRLKSFDSSIFILHFALTSLFVVIPRYITTDIALSYLIVFTLSFIIMAPFLIVAQKYQKFKFVLMSAIIIIALSQMLFISTTDYYSILILLTLFFIGFNIIEALVPSLVAKDIELNHSGKRGLVMGAYASSQFFGAFFGGIIAGGLLHYSDTSSVFIANIVLMAIWLIIISRRVVWQGLIK